MNAIMDTRMTVGSTLKPLLSSWKNVSSPALEAGALLLMSLSLELTTGADQRYYLNLGLDLAPVIHPLPA